MDKIECLLVYRLPNHKKIYLALFWRSRPLSRISNLMDLGAYPPHGVADGIP